MPVKKISDAPANIRELDGAKLTLAQINWILRVYDALKGEGKVKSPMAVAISQFKKSYHKDGDKWIKNETEGEGASMIDLERLDRYIIVPTGDKTPGEVDDLRELEGDFGVGVYPLFSDAEKSIVAFAFEPALFNDAEAQEWVKKAMEPPASTSMIEVVIQSVLGPLVKTFSEIADGLRGAASAPESQAPLSYEEKRDLLQAELGKRYYKHDPDGYVQTPWIIEMGDNYAIVRWDGKRYAVSYEIGEGSEVTLGPIEPAGQQWIHEDGTPIILHAFATRLGDGAEAEEDGDDGLVWKELIHPGQWFKTNTGRLVDITVDMIKSAYEAWAAGFPKYISVPDDSHHDDTGGVVPVTNNRGFVEKLKLIGDKLFGGFRFTDPETNYGVAVGNVADVSIYLEPNVTHPDTGTKYDWVLRHVLLTNNPLVQDLEPFGVTPVGATSGGHYVVETYRQEVRKMNGNQNDQGNAAVTLSSDEAATLSEFRGLGLSIDEIKTMQAEREQVRQKARDLEITRVMRAMEGTETHDGVVQIDGTRHYPVVCAAVEKALREVPQALGLTADENGVTTVDRTILDVVNAIPDTGRVDARLAEGPTGSKKPEDPSLNEDDGPPTDEQIKDFSDSLSPRRGSAVSV